MIFSLVIIVSFLLQNVVSKSFSSRADLNEKKAILSADEFKKMYHYVTKAGTEQRMKEHHWALHTPQSGYAKTTYPSHYQLNASSVPYAVRGSTNLDLTTFRAKWEAIDGSGVAADAVFHLGDELTNGGMIVVIGLSIDAESYYDDSIDVASFTFNLHKPDGQTVTYTSAADLNYRFTFLSYPGLDLSRELLGQQVFPDWEEECYFGDTSDCSVFIIGNFFTNFVSAVDGYQLRPVSVCIEGANAEACNPYVQLSENCTIKDGSKYSYQVALTQWFSTNDIWILDDSLIVCEEPCIPFLSAEAAKSLYNIVDNNRHKGKITLEYAFAGVFETYWIHEFETNVEEYGCTNRKLKNFGENPHKQSHYTGCAIDLTSSSAAWWSDTLISKGWVYTRPTIDKHHFEFLKCKNRLTLEDNAAAFEVLWEANEGAPFDHTDQSAVFSAIATLPKNQVFASAPSYEP